MHYYLALTSRCNLQCKYCYGKSCEDYLTTDEEKKYDFTLPESTNFSIDDLERYSKFDKNFVLTFYGGEPLLERDKIIEIMDRDVAKDYMMQTNGFFLDKLPAKYVNRISTILVSIDGTKEHTDERRGKGVYDKVISNVKFIIENEFSGEVIARMTVDETCDIYESVMHLYSNSDFSFSSIHWQIDAQFWKSDYELRDFNRWLDEKYNPGIKKLVDFWMDEIRSKKKVPMFYPFVGVMESLLSGLPSPLKCGAGHSLLGIQTNGKVVACPITAGYKPFEMGDIRVSRLEDVEKNKILPSGDCLSCEIKDVCGGRCLYANKTMLWGEIGFKDVCKSVFFLVECLKSYLDEIKEMIENDEISMKDFDYNKYNGCEIIP